MGREAVPHRRPGAAGPARRRQRVVLNTTGPFSRFGVQVLLAAIDATCHYLDARQLDAVDDLATAWPLDVPIDGGTIEADLAATSGEPSAASVRWMQHISGTIEVMEGGRRITRSPVEPVRLDDPGRGPGTACCVSHPEPITLPSLLGVRGFSAASRRAQSPSAAFRARPRSSGTVQRSSGRWCSRAHATTIGRLPASAS